MCVPRNRLQCATPRRYRSPRRPRLRPAVACWRGSGACWALTLPAPRRNRRTARPAGSSRRNHRALMLRATRAAATTSAATAASVSSGARMRPAIRANRRRKPRVHRHRCRHRRLRMPRPLPPHRHQRHRHPHPRRKNRRRAPHRPESRALPVNGTRRRLRSQLPPPPRIRPTTAQL